MLCPSWRETHFRTTPFWTRIDANVSRKSFTLWGRTPAALQESLSRLPSSHGLPHLHAVPQLPQQLDFSLLRKIAHQCGYSIKRTDPTAESPGRDAREYVAGHLKRTGFRKVKPEVILCGEIRTNLGKTEVERALRRDRRRRNRARRSARSRQPASLAPGRHQLSGLVLAGIDIPEWRHGHDPESNFRRASP